MAKSLNEYGTRDYIDSRDLIERLNELESQVHEGDTDSLDEFEFVELVKLRAICEEGSQNFSDWEHGESLIPEAEFEGYARELADDLGMTSDARTNAWPFNHVDWEAAARELKYDYSSIDIEGTTYWGRP